MIASFWYGFFLWLPPIFASLFFLKSLKDEDNQILTSRAVKNRIVFYLILVIISWLATAAIRWLIYKNHPIAQFFLPPKGELYYQIIFGRLLAKLGYDGAAAIGVALVLWLLRKISYNRWADTVDIYLAAFGAMVAGWEFALFFLMTSFGLLLVNALLYHIQQKSSYHTLTQSLIVSGFTWSLIAAYQYIYIFNLYS